MVHVRDTLTQPTDATATDLQRPVLTMPADTPTYTALTTIGCFLLLRGGQEAQQDSLVTSRV